MKYLIGIDSGGTKSELVAYDLEGNCLYSNTGGYGNPAVDIDTTLNNISFLIKQCLNSLQDHECVFISAGVAGVDMDNYRQVICKYIYDKFSIKNLVLSDIEMTAKAYLDDKEGIIVIAGTGSSCFVQKDNIGEIVGGWGHILGDEGSGYHTVIQAFKNIVYQIDNDMPFDNLNKRLMKKINASNSSDIKKYIYGNEKGTIASLFSVINELSIKGDIAATSLLKDAGKYLAQMTTTAYRKYEFEDKIKIGLKGGVFYNSKAVLSSYEKNINKDIKNCILLKEDISVTQAVYNIYKRGR